MKGRKVNNTRLNKSDHYKNQKVKRATDYDYHIGGDIYFSKTQNKIIDSTKLFIAFYIKGDGSLFEETCNEFLNPPALKNCSFKKDKLRVPFMSLYQYDTTFSLNRKGVSKFNLIRTDIDSFNLRLCEH